MKWFSKILVIGIFSLICQPLLAQNEGEQTEEYAILSVAQFGKKNLISVTIGSVSTEEKEYEKQKNEKRWDMAPVIAEMEKLNRMGYELHQSSVSMIPSGEYGGGTPFYSFIFKRKKEG